MKFSTHHQCSTDNWWATAVLHHVSTVGNVFVRWVDCHEKKNKKEEEILSDIVSCEKIYLVYGT